MVYEIQFFVNHKELRYKYAKEFLKILVASDFLVNCCPKFVHFHISLYLYILNVSNCSDLDILRN